MQFAADYFFHFGIEMCHVIFFTCGHSILRIYRSCQEWKYQAAQIPVGGGLPDDVAISYGGRVSLSVVIGVSSRGLVGILRHLVNVVLGTYHEIF